MTKANLTAVSLRTSLLILLLTLLTGQAFAQEPYDPGRASFAVGINNELYPYREFAAFVLPRERIVIRISDESDATYTVEAGAGRLEQTEPRRFVWVAPEPAGRVPITVTKSTGEAMHLNMLVMVPADRVLDGVLNGYTIGRYPRPLNDDPLFAAPRGYIEVHADDLGMPVSPHFVLGQFVSDRTETYPKYIVLRERLLLKLEALLERLNETQRVESFAILSAYRTPARNASVGGSPYSRHMYGGAAAIIVDRDPVDGVMDDLDGDGTISRSDAGVLLAIADALFREAGLTYLQGGLATYAPTASRGPYLHVDVRGQRARWPTDNDRQRLRNGKAARHKRDFPEYFDIQTRPPGGDAAR